MVKPRSKSKSIRPGASAKKFVYFFGNGSAEGSAEMKQLLGGKGANLAEMTNLGIPVPGGFTITTQACAFFYEKGKIWSEGLAISCLLLPVKF